MVIRADLNAFGSIAPILSRTFKLSGTILVITLDLVHHFGCAPFQARRQLARFDPLPAELGGLSFLGVEKFQSPRIYGRGRDAFAPKLLQPLPQLDLVNAAGQARKLIFDHAPLALGI